MRRCLLLVLLFVIPLQWTASAVAAYCLHETQPAAQAHFGHHQHDHHEAGGDDRKSPQKTSGDHPDCHVCHAHATHPQGHRVAVPAALPASVWLRGELPFIPEALLDGPYRPPAVILA